MLGIAGRNRLIGNTLLTLLTAAGLLLAAASARAQNFPALTGRVVDAANIIPADVEARLDQKLAALETQSRRQLVVTTLPSLEGYEISDYGYRLGRNWGIGSKDKNDGALLIIAPNERKLRIEVGYGLEGTLTDAVAKTIIVNAIAPRFKVGDFAGGVTRGVDDIITTLTTDAAEWRGHVPENRRELSWRNFFERGLLPMLIFACPFVILFLILRSYKRRHALQATTQSVKYRNSSGKWVRGAPPSGTKSTGSSVTTWSSGGSSSSSSSSSDSFSGGGGSSGGGGASGEW